MAVLEFEFKNDNSVFAYLHYLLAEDLAYHFDDDPFAIDWHAKTLSYAEKSTLHRTHMRLHAYCDPWAWFDRHPQMWSVWTGGSEVSTHPHENK